MLCEGDKLLVCHRRLFEGDELRFFSGTVAAYEAGIVRVTGWTFVRDFGTGTILKKDEVRTKLYSLASGTILVYRLPDETKVESLKFVGSQAHLLLTDGENLTMDLSEHVRDAA
jgi:hypothetical protein